MAEKTRYSDAELEEFRAIIMEKLELAQRDYEQLKSSIMGIRTVMIRTILPLLIKFWKKVLIHCLKKKRPVGGTSAEVYPGIAGGIGTYRELNLWYLP